MGAGARWRQDQIGSAGVGPDSGPGGLIGVQDGGQGSDGGWGTRQVLGAPYLVPIPYMMPHPLSGTTSLNLVPQSLI